MSKLPQENGDVSGCSSCEKLNKPCIYEATRKHQLATAKDRSEYLVALLRDLIDRVDDADKSRIEHAINPDSDDDYDSTEPNSAGGSIQSRNTSYSDLFDRLRQHSRPQISPPSTQHTPATAAPSPKHAFASGQIDLSYNDNFLLGGAGHRLTGHNAGYLGQISEIRWLHTLTSRIRLRSYPTLSGPVPPSTETNFYLDDRDIQFIEQLNPFHLPPEVSAMALLHCYSQTVQVAFPIVSSDIQHQIQSYYGSARQGKIMTFPQRWFAIVHLILAIGAHYSRLSDAVSNVLIENVFYSSACQLLGVNHATMMTITPDLPLIQATGLLAFYYMSIGHINRAWVTVGTALRLAIAFGLHALPHGSATDPQLKQAMTQTWWSLHNLESLLSSMTGRPCMLRNDDVTTPLPSEADFDHSIDHDPQGFTIGPRSMVFLDAQVRLSVITQEVLSQLYTGRRSARSWAQRHWVITSMLSELDDWTAEAMPALAEGDHVAPEYEMQQDMLRKQYCRVKILTTHPALRRVERCFETGIDEVTPFDQEVAEGCIHAAQEVASLFPDEVDLKVVYEKGPWWSITHNIMQALAVLLIGISCRPHFELSYVVSVAGVKKLVMWLGYMREQNETARRAYQVVQDIVGSSNLAEPHLWKDIEGVFSNQNVSPVAQAQSLPVVPQAFVRPMGWRRADRG